MDPWGVPGLLMSIPDISFVPEVSFISPIPMSAIVRIGLGSIGGITARRPSWGANVARA
jgi:hypothetical protein